VPLTAPRSLPERAFMTTVGGCSSFVRAASEDCARGAGREHRGGRTAGERWQL